MARLIHDASGEKQFETGVSKVVLFPVVSGDYSTGVVWNGFTAINEQPDGGDETALWADNIKYGSLRAAEQYKATLEAYMFPDEFYPCDGYQEAADGLVIGQQNRSAFGLAWRTEIGDDVNGVGVNYKLHFAYGMTCSPSERSHETINDSPDAQSMSWEATGTPVAIPGTEYKPTAKVEINSSTVNADKLAIIDAIVYGADDFSDESKYALGDIVAHEETSSSGTVTKLYKCTTAVTTAGAWSAANWTKIADEAGPRLPMPEELINIVSGT